MNRGTVNSLGQGLHGDRTPTGAVCISSLPEAARIFLDANGDIDTSDGSGTNLDRLKQCITDTAKP
ncbi:MAG: hypothetical protein ACOH2R_20320 [Pseudomonas sp.]